MPTPPARFAASAPTVGAPIWASSPDDTSAASWVPLTPDEMKEKYGHLVIGVPYGLQYPMRWCPSDLLVAAEVVLASEPATSSSVLLQNRRIPKRLQNNKMSEMALSQSRLRMETREYLSCLYMRAAALKEGQFSISFFNPATGVTKVGQFGPGTLYSHLYADVRSMFGVPKGSPMSMRIWEPYNKWEMIAPGQARVNNVLFGGMTLYCTCYRYIPHGKSARNSYMSL